MRYVNLAFKFIFFSALLVCITIFTAVFILNKTVSREYKINRGDVFRIDSAIPVTADFPGVKAQNTDFKNVGDCFDVDLKIFGIIPFSTASVTVVDETYVSVLGKPFGMKVYTNGVLVISAGDVETIDGAVNPAKEAGIKVGDYIVSVNDEKISCNEDLSQIVAESAGEPLSVSITRNGKHKELTVKPVRSKEEGLYRIGIWVRDSSAGVGTLTFYSAASDIICGLGHGICDSDTGELLQPEHGELVSAEIISVKKGASGDPGELKGRFALEKISNILLNAENGVYGRPYTPLETSDLTKVALKQEVKNGKAQILCAVSGNTPELYSCTVQKRASFLNSQTQNMVVTVTDERLINLTGGIIQGMSGSPILQDGKLIGAVTHVFVDDPQKGYAVYAENMLETAQKVADVENDSNGLKKAS
ncbi:MAG: SpoIVB peptidase [Clostridia bacterium]|nr:SpoIVB peptidase [Clostridia bacterium]